MWTWVALDPDSKLVPTWLVGRRDAVDAVDFLTDLAPRLNNRVQITTGGHQPYVQAMEVAFGKDVDYAMLMEAYGTADPNEPRRFWLQLWPCPFLPWQAHHPGDGGWHQ